MKNIVPVLISFVLVLIFVNAKSCDAYVLEVFAPSASTPTPSAWTANQPVILSSHPYPLEAGFTWKSLPVLENDLNLLTRAGYTSICLFDIKHIQGYPDARYIPLLKKYADQGVRLSIFVQEPTPNQETVDLVKQIGVSSVMVYNKQWATLFQSAGIKTFWWVGVGYPPNHKTRPQFMGWPDFRDAQVRQDVADWTVRIPTSIDDGLVLDYIRWNEIGDGRTAEQITDLMTKIRANWNAVGRGTLSAAVIPAIGPNAGDAGASAVGQPWDEWLKGGLLDRVYPMAYDSAKIPDLIKQWSALDQSRIIPCVRDYER